MPKMKELVPKRTTVELLEKLSDFISGYDKGHILRQAEKKFLSKKDLQLANPDDISYQAMTLLEFSKGILLTSAIPQRFRVFALDFYKQLQTEYDCQTPSEKATAELVALNYIRCLDIQSRINSFLSLGTTSEVGVKHLAILSKELDRSQRHYFTSVQSLRLMKQPLIEVNLRANTAVVGNDQLVQVNNK